MKFKLWFLLLSLLTSVSVFAGDEEANGRLHQVLGDINRSIDAVTTAMEPKDADTVAVLCAIEGVRDVVNTVINGENGPGAFHYPKRRTVETFEAIRFHNVQLTRLLDSRKPRLYHPFGKRVGNLAMWKLLRHLKKIETLSLSITDVEEVPAREEDSE